jgi:predicted membrane metal-binding protein
MHISIIAGVILFLLKKIGLSETWRYGIACCFIIIFMYLVNLCPAVLRSGIFLYLWQLIIFIIFI